MAKIYSQEVLKNLQRLLRSPNKQEVEDAVLTIPVSTKTQPIYVQEVHGQFDASPTDYLTVSTAATAVSVNAGAWGTIVTVTAGTNQYLYVWGWSVQCDTTDADMLLVLASAAVTQIRANTVFDSDYVVDSAGGTITFTRWFTKPIEIPAGSSVLIRAYNYSASARDVNGKVYLEVRKFEERL